MDRTILHVDANCFYASVEMLHHPELEGKPVAVGGNPEERHGIILTANYIAKKQGVKTGMALWQAREACPDIVILPPRMDLYLRFSRLLNEIYSEYTDQVQNFGCDESWLDVTESRLIKGEGMQIAEEIRNRVKYELGITVSVGVSWNKIFAKLGSDYKKPDAVTEFTWENYKTTVWNLGAKDLLYVGRATTKKLFQLGIYRIGHIANADPKYLQRILGKMGLVLYSFANGWDNSPVGHENYHAPIKSIGNSTTTPRDLLTDLDAKIIIYALSESVAARLRENGFKCKVVEITIRDNELYHFTRQKHVDEPTNITNDIMQAAYEFFVHNYDWSHPIRSLGVRGVELVAGNCPIQLNMFVDQEQREKLKRVDDPVDSIRQRFGYFSVQRAVMYQDKILSNLDAKTHTVHPEGYFK